MEAVELIIFVGRAQDVGRRYAPMVNPQQPITAVRNHCGAASRKIQLEAFQRLSALAAVGWSHHAIQQR
jgi:hypothetical protein